MSQDDLAGRWEGYARADAEFFIWTDVAKGDDFAASGRRDAARIMELCSPHLRQRRLAVEIGCGVGRLAIPMSREFERVIGVDIAPTMLRKLEENCRAANVHNVRGMLANDAWDACGPVDFVYSHIVLQHIEDWAIIEGYFARAARALSAAGVIYSQFDTRRRNPLYVMRNLSPDFLLPRHYRRGVRRIRRKVADVVRLAQACGLEIVHVSGAGTAYTLFILRVAESATEGYSSA